MEDSKPKKKKKLRGKSNSRNLNKEIKNMTLIQEELKIIENNTNTRFKAIDDKLNMLLVFNSALLLLISFIIPNDTGTKLFIILKWSVFAIFVILNLISILYTLMGMALKKAKETDVECLNSDIYYLEKYDVMLHSFITQHIDTIKSKREAINLKQRNFTVAMILSIVDVIVAIVGIIINIL